MAGEPGRYPGGAVVHKWPKQERNGRTLGHKISFWGAENVLGLNSGGDCATL